jgi:hypothetical protein
MTAAFIRGKTVVTKAFDEKKLTEFEFLLNLDDQEVLLSFRSSEL